MDNYKGYKIEDDKILGKGQESVIKVCSSSKYYNDELCVKIVNTKGLQQQSISKEIETIKKVIDFTNLHIVKVYEYFENKNQNCYYITMKLCNGGNLQQRIEKFKFENKAFEAKDILSFVYQFSQGYFDINSNKIILNNIGPSKILLHYGLYKIGGFGTFHFQQDDQNNLYSSPQILQQQEYTAKCDMYSLGVIIYHMSFLNLPFSSENLHQFQQQLKDTKFTVNQIDNQGLDQEKQEIKLLIEKMLVYNENERISFQELFDRVSNLPVYQKFTKLQNLLSSVDNYMVLSDVLS